MRALPRPEENDVKLWGLDTRALRGRKIAILAADGFEYIEVAAARTGLWLSGASVHVVSLHKGRIRGMNLTEPTRTIRVHRSLAEADASHYDGLYVPGGFMGPDFLRQSKQARDFVSAFESAGKPIATLCHGAWLLVSAGLVAGRRLTAWPGIRDDIVHAGGVWCDEPVLRDRNWLSGRGPQDLPTFVPAMLAFFRGDREASGWIEQSATERSSPASSEPPGLAVAAAHLMPGPALLTLASAVLGLGLVGAFGDMLVPWRRR
jgi:protease I